MDDTDVVPGGTAYTAGSRPPPTPEPPSRHIDAPAPSCSSSLSPVTQWLEAHQLTATALTATAASVGYVFTYFVRYPLFVLPGLDVDLYGLSEKTWYSLASNVGYGVSKIPAYFVVTQFPRDQRFGLLILLSTLMLVLMVGFWVWIPPLGRTIGIFLGGLPGSWIYAIVFSYFEGRGNTEVLNALLNLTIICGGALSRAVGTAFLGVLDNPNWMPLAVAATALPISFGCLAVLNVVPGPTEMDAAKKAKRRPMSGAERNAFLRRFWPGILVISVCYACIITFRSYRDYFALDIYKAVLRRNPESWLYLVADFPAGGLSSLIMLAMSRIADNRTAVMVLHGVLFLGAAVVGASAAIYEVSGQEYPLIIGVGVGLYMMWAPLPALFYDRILAASQTQGTVVFLIFLSDWAGYVGTTGLLVYQGLAVSDEDGETDDKFKRIFIWASFALSGVGMFAAVFGGFYFGAALPHTTGYQKLDAAAARRWAGSEPAADPDVGVDAVLATDSDEDDVLVFHDAPSDPAPHQTQRRSVNAKQA